MVAGSKEEVARRNLPVPKDAPAHLFTDLRKKKAPHPCVRGRWDLKKGARVGANVIYQALNVSMICALVGLDGMSKNLGSRQSASLRISPRSR